MTEQKPETLIEDLFYRFFYGADVAFLARPSHNRGFYQEWYDYVEHKGLYTCMRAVRMVCEISLSFTLTSFFSKRMFLFYPLHPVSHTCVLKWKGNRTSSM